MMEIKTKTIIALLLSFFTLLLSCTQQNKENKLNEITFMIDKSSEFIDLTLKINEKKETDTTFEYIALGLYKSDTVGFKIKLKKGLKAGIVNGNLKNVFVKNGISFNSLGLISDRLLNAMTEIYKIDSINILMRSDMMTFTCANLNEVDLNYNSGIYKFKIFMESEEANPELLVYFDFSNNMILLNEKDIEYRKDILKFLMKK